MDLPSMVQRSGDTLIVRSVVSGNQLYTEQGGHNPAGSTGHIASNATSNAAATQAGSSLLERHVERYRLQQQLQQAAAAVAVVNSVQQQQQHHQQQQQQAVIGMDAKEEGLPQCKIKRNYSCNHCAYFTQNPRYHLTHLRDVHGEKIVINKCKLCLYASRHFQKLVRHMKMVHGCTDGIPSGHGQARGKRGMSREARKRRLEESVGVMGGQNLTVAVPDVPTLEQVKRELLLQEEKLQRDIQAFNQRQREEQQREQRELELVATSAYERHMQVLRDYERQSPAEPPTPSPTSGSATPPSNGEEPQNRLLKCSACEFTTLYRTQLRAHELAEHGKTKFFRCDKCSYVTHIKARFSKHVKYHSMPMIKCVTCDFRTPYKWNLDRHMKNHGGAGAFKCAACDFTADIKQSLTVHEMNHHVPPVGNAGSIWPRRQNKVGASEMCEDFLSDSAELEDQFNNNNVDDELDGVEDADPDEAMSGGDEEQHQLPHHHHYGKRSKYDEEEEPTDLSQKGGCSSDTSSVGTTTPRAQRPVPNLIPISKGAKDVLNLSKETNASRSSLTEIASMFFNEKQISEMLDKSDVPQLSPATTVASQNSTRSQLTKKTGFLERVKSGAHYENLVCQCGHVAKCLSESIIHGKSCHASAVIIDDDDVALHEDDADDRLEIDEDDEDHHSHSALNLSVTGSTRCQHCRHRCKSSTDLLHHLKQCVEAIRCANEMYDSNSGESGDRRPDTQSLQQQAAVQQQRVCIWNKATKEIVAAAAAASLQQENSSHSLVKSPAGSQAASNEENSYYGVETAPGYGEVTKKMTPEEEAANSSLKKVYKCPHCSFWASTASRFHVHIVGHLNKKPFECSLCSYRSNWRWDITKHIRLKTIRDPSHKTAKVLMNDETGRRNYTKYNKYITLMKVTEEDGDPKLMKSGEMTPNQVASLAFLKDYAKVGSVTGQDITLEPVLPSKPNVLDDAHLADNLIRIPLLATMMNAAMAQQQHHQQQQQQKEHQSTMITPSVTISPVKRPSQGSVMQGKPSDDLITEVHQEGNEKRTVYRCRKCNFGHQNRDAVLAHVKIHYQDASYPKSNSAAGTSPLQVSVGGNPFYMNKVFAAMCLSQTQSQSSPNGGSAGTSPAISAGLLQRAIQEAQHSPTPNASALSGLALALVGGKPQANTTKASAASILEHGEQKASQNEASADSLTSPNTTTTTSSRTTKATTSTTKDTARSLQDLLTSPRSARNGNHLSNANSNSVVGNGLRQDALYVASSNTTPPPQPSNSVSKPNASPLPVTTTPSPISTATNSLAHQLGAGNHSSSTSSSNQHHHHHPLMAGDGYHLAAGLTHAHSISTNTKAHPNSNSFPSSSSSSSSSSVASTSSAAGSASASASSSSTSSPPPPPASSYLAAMAPQQQQQVQAQVQVPPAVPMPHPQTRFHSHSPGSPSLLTMADGDRRDPSPYRCGHCHQVSNWKHVIQRHCRLKHSGDIRIETLERGASGSTNAPPIYRPLGAGASNESQSHIPTNPTSNVLKSGTNATTASNNNAQLLMTTKQLEQLLHSPLSASAAAVVNAASSQQDLQVAAAYWAAAYKVASSSAEEVLQLQRNDQIEITRLPSGAEQSGAGGNNTKSKQQKCPVCPHISESKSQMNYHVSLHKPTQYECRLCTFVCAKKQHLSSHMRSVHQQQMGTGAGASVGGGGGAAGGAASQCLDFSVAYQLAAAAKQVQQLPASTPLSIDLSQLQLDAASDAELNPQQLPPEYQYKLISYCPRCPARFAQKHNDERNAKQELEEHLLAHNDQESEDPGYVCAYCEYRTAEETLLQLHRAVHMSHYQEKCQQLYKNCKEDVEFPAPKLLQLTGPETIWVVDNELSLQLLQQTTGGGVSSSTGNYDNQNSLLKKQLESGGGQVVAIPRESSVSKIEGDAPEEDEERRSSSTPSTSASVATSDLAADASSDAGSVDMPQSVPAPQRCLHCPFETQQHEELLQHLQKHACVNTPSPGCQQCAHCDYSAVEESEMEEHTALHFNASEKLKSVEFYTCYDQLEISVEREPEDKTSGSKEQQTEHNNNQDNVMNANVQQEQGSLDEEPADEAMEEPPAKKPSTKLILYKNEGGLSVKPPQEEATLEAQKSENISDRLRRRILRGSSNQPEDSQAQERPPTPDKMILVNARTGKVISKK